MNARIIAIEPAAPAKPAWGQVCNGCGVCCLAEPCPLGVVLSGRRHGACDALRWDGGDSLYRCGALSAPREVLAARLPRWLHLLLSPGARLLPRLARRWISAGSGCDCSLEVIRPDAEP